MLKNIFRFKLSSKLTVCSLKFLYIKKKHFKHQKTLFFIYIFFIWFFIVKHDLKKTIFQIRYLFYQ